MTVLARPDDISRAVRAAIAYGAAIKAGRPQDLTGALEPFVGLIEAVVEHVDVPLESPEIRQAAQDAGVRAYAVFGRAVAQPLLSALYAALERLAALEQVSVDEAALRLFEGVLG